MKGTLRLAVGLGALALAGGLTVVPPTTAATGPEQAREWVAVDSLGPGPRPAMAYLVGRKLHLPSGGSKMLPFPKSHVHSLSLLGPSPRGWIVLDTTYPTAKLFRVKGGTATKFWSVSISGSFWELNSWRLGGNGKRVVQVRDSRKYSTATVFDLDGRNRNSMRFPGYVSVLDFTGNRLVAVAGNKTWEWVIGSPKTTISPDPSPAADIRNNILWVPTPGETFGPTTLAPPGAPSWAERFLPRQVSTDGSYAVGYSYDGKRIQMRDMVDGFLVRSIRTPQHRQSRGDPLVWESDSKLLFLAQTPKGRALIRCGVSGPCKRATRWFTEWRRITVPFQVQSP